MDEKVSLLMEETNCEQAEAEIALELAQYNLEKAIRNIKNILKNIVIIKGKFVVQKKNLYGLFIMILDKKSQAITRLRCVISYNPAIYESDIYKDWDQLEHLIYRYRLQEGSVLSLAHNIEEHFTRQVDTKREKLYKAIESHNLDRIKDLLLQESSLEAPEVQLVTEEINLADYQNSPSRKEPEMLSLKNSAQPDRTTIALEVELFPDIHGKKVSSLAKGDVVLAQITDTREVARYLTKLLSSKEASYLSVPIEQIIQKDAEAELYLHFTPRITGHAKIKTSSRVKVVKEGAVPWWKRLFS